jgi:hypothetical protein
MLAPARQPWLQVALLSSALLASGVARAESDAVDEEPAPATHPRLDLGVQSGLGSPLGRLGVQADYFARSWLGLELGLGLPDANGSKSTLELLEVSWPIAPMVEQGLGIGLEQLFVTVPAPLAFADASHVVNDLVLDCSHVSLFFGTHLVLRGTLGISTPIVGGSVCQQNPDLCAGGARLWISGALQWNFDFGGEG